MKVSWRTCELCLCEREFVAVCQCQVYCCEECRLVDQMLRSALRNQLELEEEMAA